MALKVSARGNVSPFIVMDVLRAANERQAAGESVLHLEVGQPGSPAPPAVLEAGRRALGGPIGYTDAMGIPPLRERIARHYEEIYGVRLPADRIAVTPGSSGGFLLSFLAAFDPGDRVALASPGYPAYRNILSALGLEAVLLPTEPEDRFQPTVAHLEALDTPIEGLIVASPSNPTGTMLGEAEMRALVGYCREAGIRLISDEIYHGITFGAPAVTALSLDESAIVVNSFSKYFAMTGWRLGWLVLPPDLVRPVECLAQNLFISAMTVSQQAGIAAFDCRAELDAVVAGYARNRAVLLEELPKAGFDRLAPADGAFYVYADVSRFTNDSPEFCKRLLAETGVAVTPGVDFDPDRGQRFIRFSFAGTEPEMVEAMRRLRAWIA
ncbi:MAG: pyridoxal phosphate-dependent aminotransferase [Rhodovibrionaceae bacterium]|nr:pyridoxal phosphate-dependent aminotransferase [Rhodovibrionaceae bacterium]